MAHIEQFEIWIPNDTEEGRQIQERIASLLEQHSWPMRDVFGMRLAMEEALVNAIKHGNRMDSSKQVFISCRFETNEISVVIEDQGDGFDLTQVPDPTEEDNLEKPGGRGIMLIRSFMTSVEYNDRGNRLTLTKRLEAATEA